MLQDLLRRVKLLEIKVKRLVSTSLAGEYRSAFKGSGLEFDEVRLYQYGDDIRNIDWNVTARSTGQAFVKVFREERQLNVFVLLDVSGSHEFGPAGEQKLQAGIELAAVLGMSAQHNNDLFGLAAFTDAIELYFKPTKARRQIMGTLARLMALLPQSKRTNLRRALEFFRRIQKRRAVLFVISDFLDEGYDKTLVELHRKHEVNLIRLYHPAEAELVRMGIVPVVDAETSRTQWVFSSNPIYRSQVRAGFDALHERLLRLSRRYGLGYVAINTQNDVIAALETFLLHGKGTVRAHV